MNQREEFEKLNGKIGEIYDENDWMIRFGFFCTGYASGYDAAINKFNNVEESLLRSEAKLSEEVNTK